jgi:hypothetical protein
MDIHDYQVNAWAARIESQQESRREHLRREALRGGATVPSVAQTVAAAFTRLSVRYFPASPRPAAPGEA